MLGRLLKWVHNFLWPFLYMNYSRIDSWHSTICINVERLIESLLFPLIVLMIITLNISQDNMNNILQSWNISNFTWNLFSQGTWYHQSWKNSCNNYFLQRFWALIEHYPILHIYSIYPLFASLFYKETCLRKRICKKLTIIFFSCQGFGLALHIQLGVQNCYTRLCCCSIVVTMLIKFQLW